MTSRPILLDTDIGSDVDDALALSLVLAAPDALELVAVTTISGAPEVSARIAAGLLGRAGRSEVEVAVGEARPLARPGFATFGHEQAAVPDGPAATIVDESGPERIVRAARETDGLEIVGIGPMTNLARALALDPELPRRVAGITIMGGHVREVKIGDFVCAPGIDYNLCSDAEASVAVLGAGFRTTLVTADVTLQTWLREPELGPIERSGGLGRTLAAQVRVWAPVQRQLFTGMGGSVAEDNVAYLHDPLTVLSLFDPAALQFEDLRIVPTIEGGVMRTLEVDSALGIGSPMRVATGIDADVAGRRIAGLLARGVPGH